MKTLKIKENFICLLLGHRITTTRTITNHIKEYKCTICNLELTNNIKGGITFLTPECKDINETLKNFLQKKMHTA
jgi:hypothetical protein